MSDMQVPTYEAKNRLSALLAEVARGVEVTITKRGVPVARLVPATPSFDREKARRAAAGLREASRGVTLGGIKIKDLVDEGRP
jgi:prevent-host-death family protein